MGGKAAAAVALNDVISLTYPIPHIRKAVTSGKFGHTATSKDFLQPREESVRVIVMVRHLLVSHQSRPGVREMVHNI